MIRTVIKSNLNVGNYFMLKSQKQMNTNWKIYSAHLLCYQTVYRMSKDGKKDKNDKNDDLHFIKPKVSPEFHEFTDKNAQMLALLIKELR